MASAPAVRRRLRRLRSLDLRVDLVARDGAQKAGDDHPVVRCDAVLDRAQRVDALANLDLALLNHVVFVDHQQIAPPWSVPTATSGTSRASCSRPTGTRTRTK